jgi:cell division transport system ATP-binding protein
MIQLFHVTKYYDGCLALSDISLRIEKGECVLLTGPSGAGKTTLLKLIFGAEHPDEGQILVQNRNIARLRGSDVPYHRRTMGYVLQDFKLLQHRTVFENVAPPLIIRGFSSFESRRKVTEALRAVGMEHKQTAIASVLSAGEQQRACIARAIVNSPIILLADEPTGNLDPQLTTEIAALFKAINTRGTTVMMATHNRQVVEQLNGRILRLDCGHLLTDQGVYT